MLALDEAGERARGGTLYVTLEPCCHFGRTAPCTRRVIASGVSRVVIAMEDPNPLVNGQGIAELRAAGITVEVGLLEDEARRLNQPFITVQTHAPAGGNPEGGGQRRWPDRGASGREDGDQLGGGESPRAAPARGG